MSLLAALRHQAQKPALHLQVFGHDVLTRRVPVMILHDSSTGELSAAATAGVT